MTMLSGSREPDVLPGELNNVCLPAAPLLPTDLRGGHHPAFS